MTGTTTTISITWNGADPVFLADAIAAASSIWSGAASNWILVALTFLSVILIPVLILLFRGAIKWTHVEDKLGTLVDDMRELIVDKEKTHRELLEQMRMDRDATDRRLRFMEEWFISSGMRRTGRNEDEH